MNDQNWIHEESPSKLRRKALRQVELRKKFEQENKFIIVKHPTSPRCVIFKKL